MTVRPLEELVEFLDSRRRPVKSSERRPGGVPYYGANGQQGSIDGFLFDEPLVLLAEDGGYFDQPWRGIAYRIEGKAWVNNHAHVLRPRPHVDLHYLVRVLENYNVSSFITGTTRAKLTKSDAMRIPVPLPSLPEQQRIADVLDRADALRANRREALALLEELPQSIFLDMFGRHSSRTSWPLDELQSVVRKGTLVTYGIVQAGDEVEGGVPYIRTGDLVDGEIRLDGLRHTAPEIASKFQRSNVVAGDLVISIRATVGTTAMVPAVLTGANLTQGTARIAPGDRVSPRYLLEYLRSVDVQSWIKQQIKGATFLEITLGRLRELQVLLPPMELQEAFDERMRERDRLRAAGRMDLCRLDDLFASLQQRAFAGEL